MRKHKIFYTLLLTTIMSSSTILISSNIVSCGKNNDGKSKQKTTWDAFKNDAQKASAIEIAQTIKPHNWNDVIKTELTINSLKIDNNNYFLTLDITRVKKSLTTTKAYFEIDYIPHQKYNLSDWKCVLQPQAIPGPKTLELFYILAQIEPAINIVKVTKPQHWNDALTYQLSISNIKVGADGLHCVKLDIIRNNNNHETAGTFEIFVTQPTYDLSNWNCIVQPK